MKTTRLDAPHIKGQIIARVISGESHSAIARDLGVAHTTVGRYLQKEDVQELINQESLRLLEVVSDAVENLKDLVRGMSALDEKDHKGRELAFKASQRVLEATGILSSVHAPAFVSMTRDNQAEVPPDLRELLDRYARICQGIPDPVPND